MSNIKSHMVLNPTLLPTIHIVGVGAIGSKVIDLLARLGVENVHVYDFDEVEDKNTGNQAFSKRHVGTMKVDACVEMCLENSGIQCIPHTKDPDDLKFDGILFLLPDKIEVRKKIFAANKFNLKNKLIIDVRMGLTDGEVYAVNPCRPIQVKGYESTINFAHEDVLPQVASSCGIRQDLAHCSHFLAALAVQRVYDYYLIDQGDKDMPKHVINESLINLKGNPEIINTSWE